MLTELRIRNLAVIESVHLSFKLGFQVLTGETGAGKSIIIDALSLIIGGRGSSGIVRYGSDKAEVEAAFDLMLGHPVWDTLTRIGIAFSAEEPLVIRREITAQGKSTARINGQMVNLTMLREVGDWLVNIHGQHEHQSLLKADSHLTWLDLFNENQIDPIKQEYLSSFNHYIDVRNKLQQLEKSGQQALQMQDMYRFQIEEIEAAGIEQGEDEKLAEEKQKLANSERLFQNAANSYELLHEGNGGLDSISKAVQHIEEIVAYDTKQLQPLLQQMRDAYYQLEDAVYQLRDYRDKVEFDPAKLQEIEQRLDLLSLLRRKYGDQTSDIIHYLGKIKKELQMIENKDEMIAAYEQELKMEHDRLVSLAQQLSEARQKIAVDLAMEIKAELRDLHMEQTRFEVKLSRSEDSNGLEADGGRWRFHRDGWDHVEFLISPNPGEPLRSLGKVASGGELSRIMLALKTIFARVDRIPVLVFDEVDTGVSGRAAQAIAEKMSKLSRECQVFSITHLPQVACMADAHYAIEKVVEGDRTYTRVSDLDELMRRHELARMLGGVEVTDKTLSHADEMLILANKQKSRI